MVAAALLRCVALPLVLVASLGPAFAQERGQDDPEGRIACVSVEGANEVAARLECLSAKLRRKARIAQARAAGDPRLEIPSVASAPVRIGSANVFASGQRLGGDLRGATRLPVRRTPTPSVAPFRVGQ